MAAGRSVTVNVNTDCTRLLSKVKNMETRLAWAVVNAINEGATEIQKAERANARKKFTVRMPAFIDRQIAVIKPFASVNKRVAYAEVAIGQKDRLLLASFETGGTKEPRPGRETIAFPVIESPTRLTERSMVPKALYLMALKFKAARGGRMYIGKEIGMYAIKGVGVFIAGREGQPSTMIYSYRRSWTIPKILGWLRLAKNVGTLAMQRRLFKEVSVSWDRAGKPI